MPKKPTVRITNMSSSIENLPPGARDCLYEEIAYRIPGAGFIIKSNEEKYREMFYYMEKDPYIREFLLDLFFILLKPDSDKELSSII